MEYDAHPVMMAWISINIHTITPGIDNAANVDMLETIVVRVERMRTAYI